MRRNAILVIVCGGLAVMLAMGIRQSFGVFLTPVSRDLGVGREAFAFAVAVQNLLFGLAQPWVGAIADRYGPRLVIAASGLLYAVGMTIAATIGSAFGLTLSLGLLVGVALAGATYVVILGAVGQVVPAHRRSLAFGIITAMGSFGMFALVPIASMLLDALDWRGAFLALGAMSTLIIALAWGMKVPERSHHHGEPAQSLTAALGEAARHSGYWLLNLGFFVCGFHIAFVATHLPAYIADAGLGAQVSATALAMIGIFNIFGSYLAGLAGQRWRKSWGLSAIYAARGVAIALFAFLPLTAFTAIAFAAAIGFLWLSTVPLTSGLVAQIFGVRYLSTLYGIVFLSHQVGSFLGAWLGGVVYDRTGSYEPMWWASIALAVFATLIHLPIAERPVARLASQPA